MLDPRHDPNGAAPARRAAPRAKFKPVHVAPVVRPMSTAEVAMAARRNVLSTIPGLAYVQPIVSGTTAGLRWHHVTDPEALKRILLDRVDAYPKSKTTQRLLRPAIGSSIFTAEGEEWRWQRRAAAPIFNHRKMVALSPMMSAAGARTADRLCAAVDRGYGGVGVACVMEEMVTATFEVVCDALLAGGDGLDRREIGASITRYLNTIGRVSLLDILNAPNWVPRPAQLTNRGVMDRTVEMVDALIADRRVAFDRGERAGDLLDYMLEAADPDSGQRMDDATLRNNLLSFIVAGHETTALALAWSLYLLANDPEAQERAAGEARAAIADGPATAEQLERMPYLRRVIDEAMRLFPPAAMLGRDAREPDMLSGREIRPGDTVILPIYCLHRHERLWEDPHRFDPDNFLPERVKARSRFAYLPFGAGPRVCIGMSFALMEAAIILASVLARLRVEPRRNLRPEPVLTMTLRPKGGMPLRLRKR